MLCMISDLATPLYISAQMGHTRAVKLLVRSGACVDTPREDGATPLFTAAQKGHIGVVQALLAAGATVGLLGNGETALHAAVLFGRTRISHLLLLRGADPMAPNKLSLDPSSRIYWVWVISKIKGLKDGLTSLRLANDAHYSDLTVVLAHFAGPVASSQAGIDIDDASGIGARRRRPLTAAAAAARTLQRYGCVPVTGQVRCRPAQRNTGRSRLPAGTSTTLSGLWRKGGIAAPYSG
ncbi:unnamed protein product [Protopolystoma xenopodis]|uniref:Uncharacterized protein n=1 Tax=Protopolystoma xenopodis TaxID=117903 RepID=A0A3S5CJA2_9PLAT|nr:unnamed protein product [Protopolystoma xenopodis]